MYEHLVSVLHVAKRHNVHRADAFGSFQGSARLTLKQIILYISRSVLIHNMAHVCMCSTSRSLVGRQTRSVLCCCGAYIECWQDPLGHGALGWLKPRIGFPAHPLGREERQTDPAVGHSCQACLHIWPVWCSALTPFHPGVLGMCLATRQTADAFMWQKESHCSDNCSGRNGAHRLDVKAKAHLYNDNWNKYQWLLTSEIWMKELTPIPS